MMCDELDIAYDKTRLIMGCTDITPDQGGSGGSDGVERDGLTMRRVAAEGRRVLLELGGQHLGAPVEMLAVGQRHHRAEVRRCEEGDLRRIGRRKRFNAALTGRNVDAATGKAAIKPSPNCASSDNP